MALPNSVRFKASDIWDTPDDGKRYEVIEGQLYVSPAPVPEHQSVVSGLCLHLLPYIHQHAIGKLFTAPIGLVLDDENGIQPDLVYLSNEKLHLISKRGIEGAPDLLVEILSPGTRHRDRGIKMRRYAAAGVRHYWIVDPRTRALDEYRLAEWGYGLVGKHGPGAIFKPALFPELEVPVNDLWL